MNSDTIFVWTICPKFKNYGPKRKPKIVVIHHRRHVVDFFDIFLTNQQQNKNDDDYDKQIELRKS